MLINYLKIALKVLMRRKFFTAVSLFGIGFTLMVLLVAAALLDHLLAPIPPEVNESRTLHVSRMVMDVGEGEDQLTWAGFPGFRFLDGYVRGIPGVEIMSIYSSPRWVSGYAGEEKVESRIRYVDGDYWQILRFTFLEGGPFTAEDDASSANVAVISEATRKSYFGGDTALGRSFEVDGRIFRVVGVVPDVSMTRLTAAADIWAPHGAAQSQDFRNQMMGAHSAILLAHSPSDFGGIKDEFASRLEHVELEGDWEGGEMRGAAMTKLEQLATHLEGARDGVPPVGKVALMFMGIIAAFLFLPTVNLVGMNLSRIQERASEIGVRKAFGACSRDLVWQFVVENIVLCVAGGALALVGALATLHLIERYGWIPHADFELNIRVFIYAFLLACFFGLLSGVFPAWRTSRLHPVKALRGGVR